MKKSVVFAILLALFLSTTTVLALRVSYDSVQEEVLPGQSAIYTIHLTNDDPAPTTVTIKSLDLAWQMDKDSTSYDLSADTTRDVLVTYSPLSNHPQAKLYGINFQAVTSKTKESKLLPVLVVDYADTVSAEFTSLPIIDPRRSTIVKLLLKNKHNILLSNIAVSLQSTFFKQSQTTTLQGKEQKELEFPITLDPDTVEGEYTLRALATMDTQNLLTQDFPYTVGRYSNIKEIIEPQDDFLAQGQTITQTNEGNAVTTESYKKNFGSIAYTFTLFQPEPTSVVQTDGSTTVEWKYNLQPGETVILNYTTNYRKPLLFAFFILIALVLFYTLSKKHLEVNKRVLVLHTTQGGMAILKIVVTVKNPGKITIHNVSAMDKAPNTLKAPTEFGIIKPASVKDTPEGIKMIWHLASLKAGEERSLTYKIESKMELHKNFLLPPAFAKFMSGTKKIIASSSSVSLKPKM